MKRHTAMSMTLLAITSLPYTYAHNFSLLSTHPFANNQDDTLANHMLTTAIRERDTPLLEEALKDGAQPDLVLSDGWTPLHEAAANLYSDGIRKLLPNNPLLQRRVSYYFTQSRSLPARPLECILWSLTTEHNYHMVHTPSYCMTPASPSYSQFWKQYVPLLKLLAEHYPNNADQTVIATFFDQHITLPGVLVSDQEQQESNS